MMSELGYAQRVWRPARQKANGTRAGHGPVGGKPGPGNGVNRGVDDPLLWVAVASAALSGFFSLCVYSLRSSTRRRLESAFARHRPGQGESLIKHLPELQMLCALLRSVFNLSLLAALLVILLPLLALRPAPASPTSAGGVGRPRPTKARGGRSSG